MVKDHSDTEIGNPLPPHGLLFLINSKGSFICTIPDRIAHTTAFVTPVAEHWLEREIAQWVHPIKDRSDDPWHHERMILPRSYISLPFLWCLDLWLLVSCLPVVVLYLQLPLVNAKLPNSQSLVGTSGFCTGYQFLQQTPERYYKTIFITQRTIYGCVKITDRSNMKH